LKIIRELPLTLTTINNLKDYGAQLSTCKEFGDSWGLRFQAVFLEHTKHLFTDS